MRWLGCFIADTDGGVGVEEVGLVQQCRLQDFFFRGASRSDPEHRRSRRGKKSCHKP